MRSVCRWSILGSWTAVVLTWTYLRRFKWKLPRLTQDHPQPAARLRSLRRRTGGRLTCVPLVETPTSTCQISGDISGLLTKRVSSVSSVKRRWLVKSRWSLTDLNGHEKKKPFSCAACKKTYQSRTSLAQHSCSSKPQSFPCDECPKVCPSKKALTQHRLKHAPMPEFRCQFCGVEFKFRQGRDRHVKSRCRVAQETKTSKDSYPPLMLQPL